MKNLFVFMGWLCLAVLAIPQVIVLFRNFGQRWVHVFLVSLIASASLTPLLITLARRLKILDIPAGRKDHALATPLLGGVAIFWGFTLAMLLNKLLTAQVVAVLAAGALVFVCSLLDDILEIPARLKLVVQLLACGIVISAGIRFNIFNPSLLGVTANIALTALWIAGITNALNFLDGMDGLATGLATIIAFFMSLVAFQTDQPFLGWFALASLGASLGFLPYNFRYKRPAGIFLGDAGATFLGFTLASLAIMGEWADNNPIVSYTAPLLIFSVLVYDMTETTFRRIITGKVRNFREWIQFTGRDHFHHRLERVLGSRPASVLFIYMVSSTLGISAVVLRKAETLEALLLVAQGLIAYGLLTVLLNAKR